MENPYEILNVKKGATKDEIRRAYKKLAKQYHPDQYDDNPLRDLAEERMREINEAYDTLMKSASDGNTHGSRSSSYSNQGSYNNQSSYNNQRSHTNNNYNQQNYQSENTYETIRNDIYSGNLRAAEQKLNTVKTRDAEWNYLMGILFSKKGWNDSAKRYLSVACKMNPTHPEYRNALEQTNFSTTSYRQNYYGKRHRDNDMFDMCFKLWCADSLCECAGGDLIDCM